MTREEAISWLVSLTEHEGEDIPIYDTDVEALNMAINALKQEPCEDCISREAVMYYIKGYIHEIISESGRDLNEHTNRVLRAIVSGIENMRESDNDL